MRIYQLLLLLTVTLSLTAQSEIRGVVRTNVGQAIPYAAIGVTELCDTTRFLAGGYTDSLGRFSLTVATTCAITLSADALGYTGRVIEFPTERFLWIALEPAAANLETVRVTARKKIIAPILGGAQLTVADRPELAGYSGRELLGFFPAVTLTGENGLSIRGNGGVRIFINGKEQSGTSEAVRALSAERIERIEVFTTPPARFDADGTGGVINFILRAEKSSELALDVNVQLREPGGPRAGFYYTRGGRRWSTTFGAQYRYSQYQNRSETETDLPDLNFLAGERRRGSIHLPGSNFGLRYRIDSTVNISLEGNYQGWFTQVSREGDFAGRTLNGQLKEVEHEGQISLTADWQLNAKNRISILGQTGGEVEATGIDNERVEGLDFPTRTVTDEQQLLSQGQINYTLALNKSFTLRAGTKIDHIDFRTDQQIRFNTERLNQFSAQLHKYGYYVEAERMRGDWGVTAGVRYEDYAVQTLELDSNATNTYRGFFPSFIFNFTPKRNAHALTIEATYSRRLDRPGFFDLVPLVSFSSPTSRETGNPLILPEINDRWELTGRMTLDWIAPSLTVYLDNRRNNIQTLASILEPGVVLLKPENIGTSKRWGTEASAEFGGRSWKTQLIGSAFIARFAEGGGARVQMRAIQEFSLPKKWSMQLIGTVNGRERSPFRIVSGYASADVVAVKRWRKEGSTLTIRLTDVFDNKIYEVISIRDNLTERQRYKWQTRRVYVTLRLPLIGTTITP